MTNILKKTKIASMIVLGFLSYNSAFAASSDSYPSYLGLGYPLPQVNQKNQEDKNIPTLQDLLSSHIDQTEQAKESQVSEIRRKGIIDVASALGASAGLAYRMKQLQAKIDQHSNELDQVFNFKKVVINNGVLPPVLTEGLANYSEESADEVRIADKMYKIEEPAKFVSVYPTWRSYLRFDYPTFQPPSSSYLPKTKEEKVIWDNAVRDGWKEGILQANTIFENSYDRLQRDYLGMIKYKILLAEGLITPTIIAKENLGVTGGGNEMSINDQIFRITDHSALDPHEKDWKVPYPITNNVNGTLK